MPIQPPYTNGVMQLTAGQSASIKTALEAIQSSFIPTDEEPILSVHGLVSRYNQANAGNEINGDTAQAILDGE